jgi:hypothetical protein
VVSMREAEIDLGFTPYAHQRAASLLMATVRFLVLVWHRRAGKTVFAVLKLIVAAIMCKRQRGRFGYVAPQLKQAKGVAWDYLKHYTHNVPGRVVNEAELSVTLPNGARIRLYGADNPDALRGEYFDGVVLDEVADMKPEVWGEVVRPMLADREGWALFIGTPKGINLFSDLYHQASAGLAGWGADFKRAQDTDVIAAGEIEAARSVMSPSQFAQEFECDFAAAVANAMVPLEAIFEAQKRTVSANAYAAYPLVMGVDVARQGDDRSVAFLRQGPVAMQPRTWRLDSLMELADQLSLLIDRHKPAAVFMDQGGIGAGALDRLRQIRDDANLIGVDFGARALDPSHFRNRRVEMWWAMAQWVKSGGCLPSGTDLQRELAGPTYSYANAPGVLQMESKDDMRARGLPSPDLADALALTFAAPVPMKSELERYRERWQPERFVTDYDPFAERAHG